MEATNRGLGKNYKLLSKERELLVEWHRANLELGCAAELELVSNTYWDQDDHHGFKGPMHHQCMAPNTLLEFKIKHILPYFWHEISD